MKPKLQSITDFKLMSLWECAKALNWGITEDDKTCHFTCDCGAGKIRYSGFFKTEVIECENCGKRITDLTSPMMIGNSTCAMIKASEYELEKDEEGNDRFWVAEDGKGGIKIESETGNESFCTG